MNRVTCEWIDKAEGDIGTAGRELAVTDGPNHDAVCFHAQQCAEKYLKAILQERRIRVPRTHDLIELMELAVQTDPLWEELSDRLSVLNEFSVDIRYPGVFTDEATARDAFETAQEVRKRARGLLALE